MKIDEITRFGKKFGFLIPKFMRYWLMKNAQQIIFKKSIRKFFKARGANEIDEELIKRLIFGWGNQGFTPQSIYFTLIINYAFNVGGPILECGSGLSTILLGIIAQKTGNRVYSLEHDIFWYEKVKRILEKSRIGSVEIIYSNLMNYGNYDWYNPPKEGLPDNFSLIICDGPTGSTLGGRFGLIPVMKGHLSNTIILMDDFWREEEQNIVKRWIDEFALSINQTSKNKDYAILEISK